ncbi:hypothetical protein NC653_010036 [Populus alba x Populus x berolinensis]|uniref:Uncharacterized protein n=1 Tax=Populus alba x Populus x berolinensis TaxID=444605 RepID=A0AAD6QZY0_9ROSI|nr:hypothetical protein NC653_010036 [Populus alba x Populus x berolinensis]
MAWTDTGHEKVLKEKDRIIKKYHDPIIDDCDSAMEGWQEGKSGWEASDWSKNQNIATALNCVMACAREAFRLHPVCTIYRSSLYPMADTVVAKPLHPERHRKAWVHGCGLLGVRLTKHAILLGFVKAAMEGITMISTGKLFSLAGQEDLIVTQEKTVVVGGVRVEKALEFIIQNQADGYRAYFSVSWTQVGSSLYDSSVEPILVLVLYTDVVGYGTSNHLALHKVLVLVKKLHGELHGGGRMDT